MIHFKEIPEGMIQSFFITYYGVPMVFKLALVRDKHEGFSERDEFDLVYVSRLEDDDAYYMVGFTSSSEPAMTRELFEYKMDPSRWEIVSTDIDGIGDKIKEIHADYTAKKEAKEKIRQKAIEAFNALPSSWEIKDTPFTVVRHNITQNKFHEIHKYICVEKGDREYFSLMPYFRGGKKYKKAFQKCQQMSGDVLDQIIDKRQEAIDLCNTVIRYINEAGDPERYL